MPPKLARRGLETIDPDFDDILGYSADLSGRTSRDPRAELQQYPHLHGAGKPMSASTRVYKALHTDTVWTVIRHALELAHSEGRLLHLSAPDHKSAQKLIRDEQLIYFHFSRMRLWSKQTQASLHTAEQAAFPDDLLKTAFMLAEIPQPRLESAPGDVTSSREWRLVPVLVRTYAMLQWNGLARLQRVAYVSVLPHKRWEELGSESPWQSYDVMAGHVWSWADDEHCMCIPIENLKEPLLAFPDVAMNKLNCTWLLETYHRDRITLKGLEVCR